MKLFLAVVIMCCLLPLSARADDADDTLRFLVSKAELVVLGARSRPNRSVKRVNLVYQITIASSPLPTLPRETMN